MKARLSPERVRHIVSELAWGSAGGLAIVTTAVLLLFGTGP